MKLYEALRALNNAAYAAMRAGGDTTMYPDLDRQSLREIAQASGQLVADNTPSCAEVERKACVAQLESMADEIMEEAEEYEGDRYEELEQQATVLTWAANTLRARRAQNPKEQEHV